MNPMSLYLILALSRTTRHSISLEHEGYIHVEVISEDITKIKNKLKAISQVILCPNTHHLF
jgi:hypothetical protein